MSYLRPILAASFLLTYINDNTSTNDSSTSKTKASTVLGAILAADAIIAVTNYCLNRQKAKKLTDNDAYQPVEHSNQTANESTSTTINPPTSISSSSPIKTITKSPIKTPIKALNDNSESSSIPPPPAFDIPPAPSAPSINELISPPPPCAPSFDAPIPPPFNAPIPPPFDAPPMAPGFDIPPPPPDAPGAPPMAPGAPPMAPGAPSFGPPPPGAPSSAGPKKANIKPPVPMRALRWSVIQPNAISSSIWTDVDDERIKLNESELVEKFKAKPSVQIDKPAVPVRKMKVQLIDSKRSDNVSIALKRFGMTADAIRAALLSMDAKALDAEKVDNLKKILPTEDEVKAVQDYEGDIEELGAAEKFFLIVGEIPLLELRTDLFGAMLTFDKQYQEISEDIDICSAAANAIRKSKELQSIFATILKLGNFINGGTRLAGASGFQLSTINKLKDVQSSEPGYSLLHYLVEQCADQSAFIQQLSNLSEASRIEMAVLKNQVNQLAGSVNKAKTAATKPAADANDQLASSMKAFAARAEPLSKTLTAKMNKLEEDVSQAMKYYCEDIHTMKAEHFFCCFQTFRDDFKAALQKIEAKRVAAEKALNQEPIRRARTPTGGNH